MIHNDLKKELTEAMKKRDSLRLLVTRDLLSSFVNEQVSLGRKPEELIDDENALKVIRRKANQRQDSIEQYRKGGREELAAQEEAELKILESYLPAQLSEEELLNIIEKKRSELNIHELRDMGRLIGAVMKEVGTQADGSRVQQLVKDSFSN